MTAAIDLDGLRDWRLTPADSDRLVALSAEAGWNQTAADWRLMLELGTGFGLRQDDGTPVASALILPYGGRFAWVSMVLVTKAYRRRGLATRLLDRCLCTLAGDDLVPVLDATEVGRATYLRRGFTDLWGLGRWQGSGPVRLAPPPSGTTVRPAQSGDMAAIVACDATGFGAARTAMLDRFHEQRPQQALVAETDSRITGFVLARDGRIAVQLGPLAAADAATATALLCRALDTLSGPVFIDAVDHQPAFNQRLAAAGFTLQRPFIRMSRGDIAFGVKQQVFAAAGPEFG